MNKALFLEAVRGDLEGVGQALSLSKQDVLDLVNDEGFCLPDWRAIQKAYGLTDSQVVEIQLSED